VHGIATQSTRLVAVCHLGAEIGPPNTRNAVSRLAPNPISRRLAWICQTIERPADESAKAAPPRRPCAPANDPAAPFFWGTMTQLGIIDMSSHPAFENFHHGGKGPDGPFLDRWRWRLSAWRAVAMLGHAGPSPSKYAANLEPRPSVSGCPQGPGPREARSQATPHARSQRRPQRTRSLMLQANAAAPLRIVAAIDNCPRRRRQRNDEVLLGFHPRRRIQARHSPTARHAPSSLLLHALQRSEGEIASTGPAVSATGSSSNQRSITAWCTPCLGESATGTHRATGVRTRRGIRERREYLPEQEPKSRGSPGLRKRYFNRAPLPRVDGQAEIVQLYDRGDQAQTEAKPAAAATLI
jgi:hypothetical protein